MEEDIHTYSTSQTKSSVKIDERLESAVEKASRKLQYDAAHDEEMLGALAIVAEFIKDKKRVCYGGTAMNALLPDSKKFYDPDHDLPDYDFYTPDVDGDVAALVDKLNGAGFKDVYHKVGIHDGTKKILVNFTAVADISSIEPDLFAVFLKRSIVKEGIHYTDENILRMMMYLELSRPKGMVERWKKVFERLELINSMFPIRGCNKAEKAKGRTPLALRNGIIEYIIEWKRILCNGDLIPLFTQGIRKRKAVFRIEDGPPPLFTSPDPKLDAVALKKYLKDDSITLHRIAARGEIVPERVELRKDGESICMIVDEIACHSYLTVPVKTGGVIFIGSMEFLITLYLSLGIFTTQSPDYLGSNVLCHVSQFIRLLHENYRSKKSQFAPFPLECRGHQTKYTSLLRQKVERIKREKEAIGSTRKTVASKRGSTRKVHRKK